MLVNSLPLLRFQGYHVIQCITGILYLRTAEVRIIVQPDGFTAKILCQLYIGYPITYHIAIVNIIKLIAQVRSKHASVGLTGGRIVLCKSSVEVKSTKMHTFIFKALYYK